MPTATVVAASAIGVLPLPVPDYAALTPAFALMAVYHWSVYRPDLLPPSALFAVGFAQDLATGAMLPTSALMLLLARAAVLRYRRHFVGRPFPFVWAGFAALAGAAMLGLWALHCALQLSLFDLRTAIIRGALTLALFPAASLALARSQRSLIGVSA
ncbi:MAG: rod shape-determining protein MreD [Alphaproteobacteria bacterium]